MNGERHALSVSSALLFAALSVAGPHAQSGTRSPPAVTGLIVGRVVDIAGRPVSGAIVDVGIGGTGRLPPRMPPSPRAIESVPVLTGPDGFFVCAGADPAIGTISAASACARSEERRDRRGPDRRCASRR